MNVGFTQISGAFSIGQQITRVQQQKKRAESTGASGDKCGELALAAFFKCSFFSGWNNYVVGLIKAGFFTFSLTIGTE